MDDKPSKLSFQTPSSAQASSPEPTERVSSLGLSAMRLSLESSVRISSPESLERRSSPGPSGMRLSPETSGIKLSPRPSTSRRSPSPSVSSRISDVSDTDSLTLLYNLEIGVLIGHGSFGHTYIAINRQNNALFAIKKIALDRIDAAQYEMIQTEVINMSSLSHPGLLSLETSLTWATFCVMVMPLMVHRSCDQLIRMAYPDGLPETAVGLIIKDVLNALSYLHTRKIIHRTIKASHILISKSGAAVLTGFRYIIRMPHNKTQVTGVKSLSDMGNYVNWLSPEMLLQDNRGFGLNSDLYSIGITICELANGVVPYSEVSPSAILVKKLEEPPPKLYDENFLPSHEARGVTPPGQAGMLVDPKDRPYIRKSYSQYIKKFVAVCVIASPEARINNCNQAQKMRFITTYAKDPPSETLKALTLKPPALEYKARPAKPAEPVAHTSRKNYDWEF